MASCYSFIALTGTVGTIKAQESEVRFDLHTGTGQLSVRADRSVQTQALARRATVCIVGWLRSYYHHRQGCWRVVVEAGLIVPAAFISDQESEATTMVEPVATTILTRLADEALPCIKQALPELMTLEQEAAKC